MRPIRLDTFSEAQHAALDHLYRYRTAREGRLRIRALMVLLAAEHGMVAAEIAAVVREHEKTVRRWLGRPTRPRAWRAWPTPRARGPRPR